MKLYILGTPDEEGDSWLMAGKTRLGTITQDSIILFRDGGFCFHLSPDLQFLSVSDSSGLIGFFQLAWENEPSKEETDREINIRGEIIAVKAMSPDFHSPQKTLGFFI